MAPSFRTAILERTFIALASSSPSNSSSSAVAILAVIAAIVAAIVGPVVSGVFLMRDTRRSSEAERERLSATLDAEDRRLQERLSFERGETDRTERRAILDSLAEQISVLEDNVRWARADVASALTYLETGASIADSRARIRDAAGRISEARTAAQDQIERLRLRLGTEADGLVRLAQEISVDSKVIRVIDPEALAEETLDDLNKVRRKSADVRAAVVVEALKFTKARLDTRVEPFGRAPGRVVGTGPSQYQQPAVSAARSRRATR